MAAKLPSAMVLDARKRHLSGQLLEGHLFKEINDHGRSTTILSWGERGGTFGSSPVR